MPLQHPVPAQHLQHIGDMIVSFALLERQLQSLAELLLGSEWAVGGNANSITRIKATAKERHGFRFHFENVTIEQLSDFSQEIKVLAFDIQWFELGLRGIKRTGA